MKVLKLGSVGPSVELLQLALGRAGARSLAPDGIFGNATKAALRTFQSDNGLAADGVAGPATHRALMPYYTGFASHRIHRGDTLFALSQLYNVPLSAILTANPGIAPEKLAVGSSVVIPLPFDIVPTNISFTSALVSYCVRGIAARYPFVKTGQIGKSVMGRPLWYLSIGEGEKSVFYNAAHHANEWITVPLLLSFAEKLARAYAEGGKIFGRSAKEIYQSAAIYIAPCVDPDGVDLVTGELTSGEFYDGAKRIAQSYPNIPFPSGWKANIRGTDLNLQYPAGWEQARENKFALGVVGPAPADYVGSSPLSAPESRAMYDFTLALSPQLTLAYHTQGEVIYWRYLDLLPPRSIVTVVLLPSSCASAVLKSCAVPMSAPPSRVMTSPFLSPASAAGERLPFGVSTSETPATTTPSVVMRMPTAPPPGTSDSANAAALSTTHSTADSAAAMIFLIVISHLHT